MTDVRIFSLTSLDGFVADSDGDAEWLDVFRSRVFGPSGFLDDIGSVILGRRTFELLYTLDEWPYYGKHVFVLSADAQWELPDGAVFIRNGIAEAVQAAREVTSKDIWIAGGAVTMQSAIKAKLVDSIEICIAPVLLGSGLSLLDTLERPENLFFDGMVTMPDGIMKLRYLAIKDSG